MDLNLIIVGLIFLAWFIFHFVWTYRFFYWLFAWRNDSPFEEFTSRLMWAALSIIVPVVLLI